MRVRSFTYCILGAFAVAAFATGQLRADGLPTIDLTQPGLPGFTTSATISIPAGGATINSNGFDVLFTGSLTGPGGLTTFGPGSVALLGTNTYVGGTMVSSGTLIVGS